MNANLKSPLRMLLVAAAALALLAFVQGCQKEEPTAQPPSNQPQAESLASTAQETAAEAAEVAETVAETIEQTTCPVMGGPINKAIFVEHEGQKVYFCCKGCETQFQENPEKYVKLLPQFQD